MNSFSRLVVPLLAAATVGAFFGCVETPGTGDPTGASTAELTVKLHADYGASALDAGLAAQGLRVDSCPDDTPGNDEAGFPSTADCDGDGAFIRYITPSKFSVAVKRLSLIAADGSSVDIVADKGTLAASDVVDLSGAVTLPTATLAAKRYTQLVAELYYYELVMPLNATGNSQCVRIYLSDDDFPQEGNGGHHQGDITLVDDDGNELGFAPSGDAWTAAAALADRGTIMGAGGMDSETGHRRGLYGGTDLWDATDFMQGPTADVFIMREEIDLDLTGGAKTLSVVFNVADTWFYEDVDGDGVFGPCAGEPAGSDACSEGAAWSPIFPLPQVTIE